MARVTPFSIGRRWYCDNTAGSRPSFTFIIIGPGLKAWEKTCRLEYEDPRIPSHGIEGVYTHKHLKKYAKLVEVLKPNEYQVLTSAEGTVRVLQGEKNQ